MLDIIDLENGSTRRRHLDQVRTGGNWESKPRIVSTGRVEGTSTDCCCHRHRSNKANSSSDVKKEENLMEEAIGSNDDSEERWHPEGERRYRPPEGFAPR